MGSGGQIKGQHMAKVTAQKKAAITSQPAPAPNPDWPANYTLVGPEDTALGREALAYRERHDLWSGVNIAVIEYRDANGELQMHAAPSGNNHHSERNALDQLAAMGVPASAITQIYTEREPCCLPGAYCADLLEQRIPGVPVSFSYEYGEQGDSRDRGNESLRGDLDESERRSTATDDAVPDRPVDQSSMEDRAAASVAVEAIQERFKDNPTVSTILAGLAADKTPAEIRKEMGLSEKDFKKAMDLLRKESRAIVGD